MIEQDKTALRRTAEQALQERSAQSAQSPATPLLEAREQTLHELRVHQIELEMQNEELQRRQHQLDAANKRYFDLYDLAPVGYCTLSEAGVILQTNLTACTMLGIERSALVKQVFSSYIFSDDRDGFYLMSKELRKSGSTQSLELRLVKQDDPLLWVQLVANASQDDAGGLVLRLVITDISQRKLHEQLLVESESKLQAILNQSSSLVYVMDLSGRFTLVNQPLAALFGQPGTAILGKTRDDFLPKEIADQHRANDLDVQASGEPRTLEESNDEPNGKRTYLSTKFALRDQTGSITAVCGISTDITEKKRAEEEIARQFEQLKTAFMGTVDVATTLCELRDPYTAGHQRRVGMLAQAIGAELGLDANRTEGLRVAGYLHDIGKMMIPAEILSKPGKLSSIEYQLLQGHAQAGYEVLRNVTFPWPLAEVALQHHERMDGSGYPQGLKGEAILLEARIMSVADVVEAMASHRPYRPGLGVDAALEEIALHRGTRFDQNAVDACIRLFRQRDYKFSA
jgi:PAS domain S-box-containing protein/putative nucleotidyltransferase with HDIG domain